MDKTLVSSRLMTSSPYPLEARDGNLGVVTCRHLQLRPERSLVGALNEAQLRRKTGAEAVERRAIPAGIFGESARSATRISSQADPGFAGIARSRWRGGHSVCDRGAKAGHSGALRLIFERLLAPQRRRTVEIDLPTIATPADVPRAPAAVTAAAAAGQITPDEAAAFGSLISATRQALELAEIDLRLRKLEGEQ